MQRTYTIDIQSSAAWLCSVILSVAAWLILAYLVLGL